MPDNLATDFFYAEVAILDRITAKMVPNPLAMVASEREVDAQFCCTRSPYAVVIVDDPAVPDREMDTTKGTVPIHQRFSVILGADIGANRCNGYDARRALGEYVTLLLGIEHMTASRSESWPRVEGVLPGWRPTPRHGPMHIIGGPEIGYPYIDTQDGEGNRVQTLTGHAHAIIRFQTDITIGRVPDAES